jgi:NAD(P)-binding Rossmann-like domain
MLLERSLFQFTRVQHLLFVYTGRCLSNCSPSFRSSRPFIISMSSHLRSDNGSNGASRMMKDRKGYSTSASKHLGSTNETHHSRAAPSWNLGRRPHVVVVGAGVAGLRCAEALLDGGIRVTLVEGRNRVGGRVSGLEWDMINGTR